MSIKSGGSANIIEKQIVKRYDKPGKPSKYFVNIIYICYM